jgi:hypothetical protein
MVLVSVSLLAGTGKFTSRSAATPSARAATQIAILPNQLAYAIALEAFSPDAHFGVVDLGTGKFSQIADLPPNASQGIARSREGRLYGVDAENNLFRIDPGNGKTRVIGATGITTPSPKGSIRIDVIASLASDDMFVMDYANNLYSVDPDTGAATLVGNTGIPAIVSRLYSTSLAGDCHHLYFTIWEVDDGDFHTLVPPSLYRIDPLTATATYIGPTITFMPGSAFVNGVLYGFTIDTRLIGFDEGPHIFSIDTSTGAATKVSDLNVAGLVGAVRFAGMRAGQCNASAER